MKAIVLHQFGDAQNLRYEDAPEPRSGVDELLIRVEACGVCYHDVINRRGGLPRTRLPAILGHEVCGSVIDKGPGVRRLRVGDRVASLQRVNCGRCHFCTNSRPTLCRDGAGFFGEEIPGGYADYFVAPEHVVVKVPDSVPAAQASVTACTLGTAVHVLETRAKLLAGETLLITGASGGVGIHAIQLARLLGANVAAITSSAAKVELLKNWGAQTVIHAPDLRFSQEVKRQLGGADIALEVVGSATLDETLHSLKRAGRLVVVGNLVAGKASFNPGLVILKELQIIGSFAASLKEVERAFELVMQRNVQIVLSGCFPLEDAIQCHRLIEDRAVTGRLVLQP
jgi:acryloyl-coenzyme A reductase